MITIKFIMIMINIIDKIKVIIYLLMNKIKKYLY
jgi:hypothetical protein